MSEQTSELREDARGGIVSVRIVPEETAFLGGDKRHLAIFAGVAFLVALVSLFILGPIAESPDTWASQFATLDAKRDNVLGLMASATGLSAALTFIPDDACTPIATELAETAKDMGLILTAIYLEKYALTILGLVAFRVLVPIGGVLLGAGALLENKAAQLCRVLRRWGFKVAVLGLAMFLVVPASVFLAERIDETYETSVASTMEQAEQTQNEIEGKTQEGEGDNSWNPLEAITQIPNQVNGFVESARQSIGNFMEAFAVMLVTSCVIPVLVLFFFLWLANMIMGANVDAPLRMLQRRVLRTRFADMPKPGGGNASLTRKDAPQRQRD